MNSFSIDFSQLVSASWSACIIIITQHFLDVIEIPCQWPIREWIKKIVSVVGIAIPSNVRSGERYRTCCMILLVYMRQYVPVQTPKMVPPSGCCCCRRILFDEHNELGWYRKICRIGTAIHSSDEWSFVWLHCTYSWMGGWKIQRRPTLNSHESVHCNVWEGQVSPTYHESNKQTRHTSSYYWSLSLIFPTLLYFSVETFRFYVVTTPPRKKKHSEVK